MSLSIEQIRASRTLAVIDGNSLMHRAFHAVPLTMNAPDGRPTNACFGFLSMLLKLIEDYQPNGIVCAFDHGKPQFRIDILQQYKAQRPPTDPALKQQFPMMQALLEALSIPVLRSEGWEGDDILGTVAAQAEKAGLRVLLVTGDKDAMQLVSDDTCILRTVKGTSEMDIYDEDAVFERYGVTPKQIPDFLGLMGDSSDNIPGVAGIGEKTATKLLSRYDSIEGIYASLSELSGKMAERLAQGQQDAYDSRKVATISREAPVSLDIDAARFPAFDPALVRDAFAALGLRVQLARVLALTKDQLPKADSSAQPDATFTGQAGSGARCILGPVLEADAAWSMLQDCLTAAEPMGVLLAQSDGFSLFDDEQDLYVATRRGVARFTQSDVDQVLTGILAQGHVVALDAKELLQRVHPADSSQAVRFDVRELDPSHLFDLSLAAYLLDSSKDEYLLEEMLQELLGLTMPQARDEGLEDRHDAESIIRAACILALHEPMREALQKDGSLDVFNRIEMPLLPVLVKMERTGVDLDTELLKRYSQSTAAMLDQLEVEIYRLAGQEFNIDSPKQLGVILFDKLKLPVIKKTKTGYSTNAQVLSELAPMHPLPAKIIEYREIAKIKSTYIDALPKLLAEDGRLHTHFNQTVAATGRLSSSDPNLQNIPVRTDFGRQIRSAFAPKDPGWVYLSADYSQIELRLLAHFSGDQDLIDAFRHGNDFHRATAAGIFGVDPSQVDTTMRSRAKAVNFGIVYGQQAFGLSRTLGISMREAQQMIDRYFAAYPGVAAYLDAVVENARRTGFAITYFGRKRRIKEISASNANLRALGERTAMNHPMQGTAADIIKLAMIEVDKRLAASGLKARFCLQIHDELDFECPQEEVEQLGALVKDAMEHVVQLQVPLDVSVATGPTWADAK